MHAKHTFLRTMYIPAIASRKEIILTKDKPELAARAAANNLRLSDYPTQETYFQKTSRSHIVLGFLTT